MKPHQSEAMRVNNPQFAEWKRPQREGTAVLSKCMGHLDSDSQIRELQGLGHSQAKARVTFRAELPVCM